MADFYLWDLEYTAWEGSLARKWSGEGEYREIVQIGCVKIGCLETLDGVKILNRYVRPRINPRLSSYFMTLTGISQEVINRMGVDVGVGLKDLANFTKNGICISWGCDEYVMQENIKLCGLTDILLGEMKFIDAKYLFKDLGVDIDNHTSGEVWKRANTSIVKPGVAHNAIGDCISMLTFLNSKALEYGHEKVSEVINAQPVNTLPTCTPTID